MIDKTMRNKNVAVNSLAKKAQTVKTVQKVLIYAVLVLYAIIIIFPFSIILLTSLKTWQEASSVEFSWLFESGVHWDGYQEVFKYKANMMATMPTLIRSFMNTLLYVLPTTLIGLMVGSLSAYVFAKYQFRGRNFMYAMLLATMMIPGAIMLVPSYSLYDALAWIDTPLPLILPGLFSSAACVFFMRQFFTGIPDSILEAAKLDGVGLIGIFFKIMIPLSTPALIAQGLLGFIGGYNDYLGPLVYLQSSDLYTLQLALRSFASVYDKKPNFVMAATIMALLPTLAIYFIAQDFFIEGIAASAIKG